MWLIEAKKGAVKTSIAPDIAIIPILLAFVSIPIVVKSLIEE
tara:strand:+ start:247 stop:372 length:126 start_codon:yes stop_codon:yes gene_type:complete